MNRLGLHLRVLALLLCITGGLTWTQRTIGAPPDTAPTLALMVDRAEHVCLIEASTHNHPKETLLLGQFQYNIVSVAKSLDDLFLPLEDVVASWPKGTTIHDGDLYLLLGRTSGQSEFGLCAPIPITEDQYDYAVDAPPSPVARRRLKYFARFLNSPDKRIAGDALTEVGLCSLRELAEARDVFPETARQQFRKWFTDPDAPDSAHAICARALGVIGTPQDIPAFESLLARGERGYREGSADLIAGYLLLAGERGLDKIDQWKLREPIASTFDVQGALQAVQSIDAEFTERIPRARLLQTVRLFLDRPNQVQAAIALLARWNDWSVADRLIDLYGKPEYDFYLTKREIVRYLFAATRSRGAALGDADLRKRAARFLDILREKDPEMVARVQQTLAGNEK